MALKLNALRPSKNPNAEVDPITGCNVTSTGRGYMIGEFTDPNNPFMATKVRTIFTDNLDLKTLKSFVGKVIPGASVVAKQVPSYEVNGRTVTSYSAVVLPHETWEQVFAAAGHAVSEESTTVNATTGEVVAATNDDLPKGF